jgi:hypothetical protein
MNAMIEAKTLQILAEEWRRKATHLEVAYSGDVVRASVKTLENCAEELELLCKNSPKTNTENFNAS